MKKVYSIQFAVLLFTALLNNNSYTQVADDCTAHPDDEMMHDEHCAVFAMVQEADATHISINNGSWFSASTWNTGTIPNTGAKVLIDSGFTVTYDAVSETEINWLRVQGTLNFSSTLNTKIKVLSIVVDPIGHLNIGTAASPVINGKKAEIIFSDQGPINIVDDPFEFGKGLISHGYFVVNGYYKKTYCGITKQLNAGASNLKLGEVPTGWQVGDLIVIPGTYGSAIGDFETNVKFHDEVLTITSISDKTIYFTNNATGGSTLQYEHKFPTGYGLKMYVANITRNVIFESENYLTIPIDQRGHIMLMHNVAQSVSNAALNGLGRTDKNILVTDPVVNDLGVQISGGGNVRGRYSIHFHKTGTNNIAATPALIKGCAVVDATSWGIVNHESNVTIEDNVVFDYGGAAFVTEAGNELGAFNRNIAIKGKKATLFTDFNVRTPNFDFGFEGNAFWIQSSNVSYENNIATSCAGDAYKVFSDDAAMPAVRRIKIPAANILNPVITGTDDSIYTAVVPMRKFSGNIAYNCNSAMMFWTHLLNSDNVGDFSTIEYDPYTHNLVSLISDFQFWNMLAAGISVKYSGQVHFKNGLLLGDITNQFQASDWISGNPSGGFAFLTSTVTGQIIYEGLTVKGWKRGIAAGRTDDLKSGDDLEYNYRNSKLIGGTFNNNLYNIYPE
ncbi:MAG: G8 domain-containing protein, partial [Chitinophagales bacterium]